MTKIDKIILKWNSSNFYIYTNGWRIYDAKLDDKIKIKNEKQLLYVLESKDNTTIQWLQTSLMIRNMWEWFPSQLQIDNTYVVEPYTSLTHQNIWE